MLTGEQILTASLDEIVFQNRNQGYGAFILRKDYGAHMKVALSAMMGLCLCSFILYFTGSSPLDEEMTPFRVEEPVTLVHPPVQPDIPLPPPPPQSVKQQVFRSEIFTPPLIVSEIISPENTPPSIDELDGAQIALVKSDGEHLNNIVAPPVEIKGLGNSTAPKVYEADEKHIWTSVEIVAEFPGGQGEWTRYLQKNLRYPDDAIDNGTQGVVRVQFIVDREGNISEVQALNDPGDGLAEEAVRIIRKGPKWKPAEQNGRKVICRHIQAITFRLE